MIVSRLSFPCVSMGLFCVMALADQRPRADPAKNLLQTTHAKASIDDALNFRASAAGANPDHRIHVHVGARDNSALKLHVVAAQARSSAR